jgi:SNF2 family DNA or RNA helicase
LVITPSYELQNGKVNHLLVAEYFDVVKVKEKTKPINEDGEEMDEVEVENTYEVLAEEITQGDFKSLEERNRALDVYLNKNVEVRTSAFDRAFTKRRTYWEEIKDERELMYAHTPSFAPMKPHQVNAVSFAMHHKKSIISLAPGTGKTLIGCVFAYNCKKKTAGRILIVCPASKITDWINEYKQWTREQIQKEDVMSYESIMTSRGANIRNMEDKDKRKAVMKWMEQYNIVVLDECHRLKSENTDLAKYVVPALANVEYSILLSGTPMPNRPSELYNLLHIVDQKNFPLGEREKFDQRYCGGYAIHENGNGKQIAFYNRGSSFENELEALLSFYMYKNPDAVSTSHHLIRQQMNCVPIGMDDAGFTEHWALVRQRLAQIRSSKPHQRLSLKRLLDKEILKAWYVSGHFKSHLVMQMVEAGKF